MVYLAEFAVEHRQKVIKIICVNERKAMDEKPGEHR
jgi:hypothetical protein